MITLSGQFTIRIKWANRAPTWLTTSVEFIQGIPQTIRFDTMVKDPDPAAVVSVVLQDATAVIAKLAPYGITFTGLGSKDAAIVYDGKDLGATATTPVVVSDAFVASANDGVTAASGSPA